MKLTISDDGLRGLGIHNTGQMRVQHAAILVISSMDLKEVGPEILDDDLILILTFTKGENAVKDSSVNDSEIRDAQSRTIC